MSNPTLESTTYRFGAGRADEGRYAWPKDALLGKAHHYRPDHLAFEIHVTHQLHHVAVQRVQLSGFRVLADGSLSEHRVIEGFDADNLPDFIAAVVGRALEAVSGC